MIIPFRIRKGRFPAVPLDKLSWYSYMLIAGLSAITISLLINRLWCELWSFEFDVKGFWIWSVPWGLVASGLCGDFY